MASLATSLPTIHLIEDARARYDVSGGFTMIPDTVRQLNDGYALAVYEAIARHANNGIAHPSVALLCTHTGWSRKIVERSIKKLIDLGILEKERRFQHGMKNSNLYRLAAYVPMVPTVPTIVPTERLDSSHGTIGSFPQNHKQEPVELKPVEQEEPPISPKGEKPKKTLRALPDDFEVPMDDWTAMMTEQRMSDHDLTVETERFKDYCLTHGKRYRDWIAAWRNWMRSPYRKPVPATNGNGAKPYPTNKWGERIYSAAELARMGNGEVVDEPRRDDESAFDVAFRVVSRRDHGGENQRVPPGAPPPVV